MYGIDIECNHYPGETTTWKLYNISFKTLEEHTEKYKNSKIGYGWAKLGMIKPHFSRAEKLQSCIINFIFFAVLNV